MKSLCFIAFCFVSVALTAQETLYIYPAEDGIYLRWQGERNDALQGYHVYRKAGEGEFERLTTEQLSFPENEQTVKSWIPGKVDFFYAMLGLSGGRVTAADVRRAAEHEVMGGLFEATFAADADMAELLGERFVDRSSEKGTRYTYRITSVKYGNETVLHEKGPLAPYQPQSGPSSPPVQIVSGDGELMLQCTPPASALKSGDMVSWQVFRSNQAEGPYQRVNLQMGFPAAMRGSTGENKQASLNFNDGFLENGREYFYRVRMVNVAGVAGPQSPVYSGVPKKTGADEMLLVWDIQALARKVVLHWQSESTGLPYRIMRANQRSGTYRPAHRGILRTGADSWLDADYRAGELRYYFLEIRDDNDRVWRSDTLDAFYGERLPPSPPGTLTAALRDTFIVDLQWEPSTTAGSMYDVERLTGNNARSAVKVNPRPIANTLYTDTLRRGASGEYQYRVRAVSAALQHSEPTPTATVEVPDFQPPQAPIAWRLDRDIDEGVMQWHPVPEEDLEKYEVFWSVDNGNWQRAHEGIATTFRFALEEQKSFFMAVRAVDRSGNEGAFSDTLKLRIRNAAPDAPVIKSVEKRGKGLELQWESGDTTKIHRLVLSRIDPVSGKRLDVWQGKAATTQFFDKYASPEKHWRFELIAYDRKWRKGKPAVFLYEPDDKE